MPDVKDLLIDGEKDTFAFVLTQPAVDYIDQIAALSGERNRSAALRRIIREHSKYESLKEQGLLTIKKTS